MSLFIDDSLIEVQISYKITEGVPELAEDDSGTDSFSVSFKMPNFKENSDILSKVIMVDASSEIKIDPMALRYERLVTLIKKWSITDESGNVVRVSRDSINKLHPNIASAIADKMDEFISF